MLLGACGVGRLIIVTRRSLPSASLLPTSSTRPQMFSRFIDTIPTYCLKVSTTPTEMPTSPEPRIRICGDEAREELSDMRNPYRDVLANTSCDEKALEISTTKVPFDSQDREEQQPIRTPGLRGPKMSRGEWWTKFAMGCVLGLVVGVVLGVRSVSLRDGEQRGCVKA